MADIGKVNLKAGFNYKLSVRNQTVALLFTWKKKLMQLKGEMDKCHL